MSNHLSRREWLAAASAGAAVLAATPSAAAAEKTAEPFVYCLNTSTIREQKLSLEQEVDLAAKVGYQAIEPWTRELEKHVKDGKSLKDLGKRIADAGLVVPDAIGFAPWIVDDETARKKGLDQARREMEMVAQIGGTRIAAPPAGATNQGGLDLLKAARRYRALIEAGESVGVTPQVEVWGFSKNLSRLGETALVALESGHSKACVLADVYHLHKGGSGFAGLKLLSPAAMQVVHLNDYPATPGPDKLTDAHRVYPGDGVAPLRQMLRDLHALGFRGVLSLELFNPDYWKQDPALVAQTGLEKMKAVVAAALA